MKFTYDGHGINNADRKHLYFGARVATFTKGHDYPDHERDTIGKLLAAAPDLLDACVEASALFDNFPEIYSQIGTLQVLRNAILAATGNDINPFLAERVISTKGD